MTNKAISMTNDDKIVELLKQRIKSYWAKISAREAAEDEFAQLLMKIITQETLNLDDAQILTALIRTTVRFAVAAQVSGLSLLQNTAHEIELEWSVHWTDDWTDDFADWFVKDVPEKLASDADEIPMWDFYRDGEQGGETTND